MFSISSAIGVPVVTCTPVSGCAITPDRILTASGSCRWVVKRDWPGRRRSRSSWMSSLVSGICGGQPSTTQPIAIPWLSPKVVTRNMWPKVLKDIFGLGIAVSRAVVTPRGSEGSNHGLRVLNHICVSLPSRTRRPRPARSAPRGLQRRRDAGRHHQRPHGAAMGDRDGVGVRESNHARIRMVTSA